MSEPFAPRCPGCGYPILGLRDMMCPECGRKLDVRDFSPEESRGDARKYERDSAIGGMLAIVLIGVVLAPFLVSTIFFARYGVVPICFVLPAVLLLAALVGVSTQTGRSMLAWFKSKR